MQKSIAQIRVHKRRSIERTKILYRYICEDGASKLPSLERRNMVGDTGTKQNARGTNLEQISLI